MISSFENFEMMKLPENSNLQEEMQQNWQKLPLTLPSGHIEQAKKILTMIGNIEVYSPCSQAKISKETVKKFQLLDTINYHFSMIMMENEKNLKIAINNDKEIAKIAHHYTKDDFIEAVALGFLKGGKIGANIPYVWLLTMPLGFFLGGLYGATDALAHQYTSKKIQIECSKNRKEWLETVFIKERMRIARHMEMIKVRVATLKEELEELDVNLVDENFVDEMKALDQLAITLNPNEPILINGESILKYLEKYA